MKTIIRLFEMILAYYSLSKLEEKTYNYEDKEPILWQNTAHLYIKPGGLHHLFSLPYCIGDNTRFHHRYLTLGEVIQGVKSVNIGVNMSFVVNSPKQIYCSIILDKEIERKFIFAARNKYWYQMTMDNMPIWGSVGITVENETYIWTHKTLKIANSGSRIVKIAMKSSNKVKITSNAQIFFSYEVIWEKSNAKYKNRFNKYPNFVYRKQNIYISLIALFILIMAVEVPLFRWQSWLRDDFERYSEDKRNGVQSHYGWILVSGDVCRRAPYQDLLKVFIFAGITIMLCIFGKMAYYLLTYDKLVSSELLGIAYMLSFLPMHFNHNFTLRNLLPKTYLPRRFVGTFLRPTFISHILFSSNMLFFVYLIRRKLFLNMFWAYTGLFKTYVAIFFKSYIEKDFSCLTVNVIPRDIPRDGVIARRTKIIFLTGLVLFLYILNLLGFLVYFWTEPAWSVLGAFIGLLMIFVYLMMSLSALGTYFLLNAGDYHWQWTCFLASASVSIYMYSVLIFCYYFLPDTHIIFIPSVYFRQEAIFCIAVGITLGTIGYRASLVFVQRLFRLANEIL